MSFVISVHAPHPEIPLPDDPEEFDAWLDECNKYLLYEQPLGADSTVGCYWSCIAQTLGLPLVTAIYNHGLDLEGPAALLELERELDQLEHYWHTHELADPEPLSAIRHELREHLQERMSFLREAIQVARTQSANLSVS